RYSLSHLVWQSRKTRNGRVISCSSAARLKGSVTGSCAGAPDGIIRIATMTAAAGMRNWRAGFGSDIQSGSKEAGALLRPWCALTILSRIALCSAHPSVLRAPRLERSANLPCAERARTRRGGGSTTGRILTRRADYGPGGGSRVRRREERPRPCPRFQCEAAHKPRAAPAAPAAT